MTHFLQDILRQPDELRSVIELLQGKGSSPLSAAAAAVRGARHVYLTGIGASYNAGLGAASHFHSAGHPVYLIDAAELLHTASIPAGSVLIVLSRSGRSIEIVKLLLAHGANPKLATADGQGPIILAVGSRNGGTANPGAACVRRICSVILSSAIRWNVSSLEIANGRGKAKRELESASELVEFPLPVVLTVDQGLNKERLPSLKGIMAAKKKPLESKPAQVDGGTVSIVKMELPPERAAGKIIGEGAAAVPELVRLLQTEAKVL